MSLTEQLEIRSKVSRKYIPPDNLAVMDRCTEDLERWGMAASCLREGDTAPDFVLPNPAGKSVSPKEILKQFYLSIAEDGEHPATLS